MKHITFLLFFTTQLGFSQTLTFVEKKPLKANFFVGVDGYKNYYYVNEMEVHKKGENGDFVYANYLLGEPSAVDIINPLKILVFYEAQNVAVFLDNRLVEIERINFNTLQNFINVSHASNAGNNRLWIFNVDLQQLELYNYRNNTKVIVSQPFAGALKTMASNFNYCYTLTDLKLRGFNIYGSLLFEDSATDIKNITKVDDTLFLLKEHILANYTEKEEKKQNYELPEITVKDLHLTQDFLYIYDGNYLHTFSLTQPKK